MIKIEGAILGEVANVLNCDIVVSELETLLNF